MDRRNEIKFYDFDFCSPVEIAEFERKVSSKVSRGRFKENNHGAIWRTLNHGAPSSRNMIQYWRTWNEIDLLEATAWAEFTCETYWIFPPFTTFETHLQHILSFPCLIKKSVKEVWWEKKKLSESIAWWKKYWTGTNEWNFIENIFLEIFTTEKKFKVNYRRKQGKLL